ncbi:MAG: hypothetical protein GW949_08220, partial [Spirochaetales bacterium]|nr:hypothetical protein [Spirochaetales bacterium]
MPAVGVAAGPARPGLAGAPSPVVGPYGHATPLPPGHGSTKPQETKKGLVSPRKPALSYTYLKLSLRRHAAAAAAAAAARSTRHVASYTRQAAGGALKHLPSSHVYPQRP